MSGCRSGIPAFFTPTGVGTTVAEGDGQELEAALILETASADFAMIAPEGDREGNLIYRESARNFAPLMAMAARCTIVEVEELLEPGQTTRRRPHSRIRAAHLPGSRLPTMSRRVT